MAASPFIRALERYSSSRASTAASSPLQEEAVPLGGIEHEIIGWGLGGGRGLRIAILGEDGEPVEYGEERRPRVRGAGGLERGAGDLVGASEHAKGLDEVILEGGLVGGEVDALEEDAERGLDVARGRERPAERDGGGEVGVDDAERGGLRGAVGEVGGGADGGSAVAAAEAGGVGVAAGEGGVEVADGDSAGV